MLVGKKLIELIGNDALIPSLSQSQTTLFHLSQKTECVSPTISTILRSEHLGIIFVGSIHVSKLLIVMSM